MANTLLLKYNSTAGTVPTTATVKVRELAMNTADGVLYTQTAAGQIKAINPLLGQAPMVAVFDFGSIPVAAATFTVAIPGLTTSMFILATMNGTFANGAYADELEMEPMIVAANVLSAGQAFFSLSCTDTNMLTVGKKTVTFYAG